MEAQNPLILRCNRLIEAFAKSDDERDFYLDRYEGFILYADLEKTLEDLENLEKELKRNQDRYCLIPKLTFYETKKIMEGFVNEKVYDIDTKEKLLDIIQSKEARENFLEFIYDHHTEWEKWQTFYQERSRIRIIEWLRNNQFTFVFEEDLDFPRSVLEKLKRELFQLKVGKDVQNARKALVAKAKTYYSNEALNPRPKRGRPPKQAQKLEIEPQFTVDIYTTVPSIVRPFLFIPDLSSSTSATFSSKFGTEDKLFANRRNVLSDDLDLNLENINQKLASLRNISSKWIEAENAKKKGGGEKLDKSESKFEDDEDEEEKPSKKSKTPLKQTAQSVPKSTTKFTKTAVKKKSEAKSQKPPAKKAPVKTASEQSKKPKKKLLRPIKKISPKKLKGKK